ncbi:hypothetical protein [Streptomyces sp. NRRL S-813]|uniref:hypothetical protein n=1 Tax=Streptomyces sp. NRRL S-813 TaxID=1463919 RepID=UPI0004BFCF51|nr:hypothetical protein [Streptomyces sp. NRRL S-813]
MRTHTVRTVVTLAAAAVLSAGMATASAAPAGQPSPSAGHGASHKPVLVDCFWKPQARPDAFILACGDANSRLSSLHWSTWNGRSAVAKGVNFVNDCKPYCAKGTFRSYPVIVRLDRPEPWKKDPKVDHFTRISLVFTGARPEGYDRVMTTPLWD